MRRDMDLIRKLLLKLEDHEPVDLSPYTEEQIGYHVALLVESGLAHGQVLSYYPQQSGAAHSLTWAGHEFLDAARSQTLWNQAKQRFAQSGVEMTIDTAKAVLAAISLKSLGL
jgi:hypothetical protein